MAQTTYFGDTYPDDNQDPYFDTISAFFQTQDSRFYSYLGVQQPILGGGTIAFTTQSINPYMGQLTWTSPFELVIPGSGFYLQIPYGPDQASPLINLVDGDRVIVNVPLTSAANVQGYLTKVNGPLSKSAVVLQGLLTFGIYRNGVFYSNFPKTLP